MRMIVIDGQGGNVGRQLVKSIKESFPEVYVRAIGTNSTATTNMLKGGADEAATGENAVITGCRNADLIVGPIGIIIADALLGEVTPKMAEAVGASSATKILIPRDKCEVLGAGAQDKSTGELIEEAIRMIRDIM